MKIGVWILSEYSPSTGGGFSLYDKMIELIDQYPFSSEVEVCFVGHNPGTKYRFKKEYVCIDSFRHFLPFQLRKYISRFSHKINFLTRLEHRILRKNSIELIYYPVQGFRKINNFPFAVANWDLGHKSSFAFPEFAMNKTFEYREKWYSKDIFKALMVFAESVSGKEELTHYTGLRPERIGVVPLFAGGVVETTSDQIKEEHCLSRFGLISKKYFFYPAQFWAHKNHYNLLLAFKEFVNQHHDIKLVLTGADKGNKQYVIDQSLKLGLNKTLVFTGFVSVDDLSAIYRNAIALVMPSFCGPTNMPLLEARDLNCPVLCSDLSGHREIMQDGAYYFDPLDYYSICSLMQKIMKQEEREALLYKAAATIKNSVFNSTSAISALESNFIKLSKIRTSWGQYDKIF